MKIAIFSDSHDNLSNLKRAVDWVQEAGASLIIHCGDVCRPDIWSKALKHFSGDFKLCLGNADKGFSWEQKIKEDKYWRRRVFKEWGTDKKGGLNFAFTHFKDKAVELARKDGFDFIFYGHTHKPWKEKAGETLLVNPGNIAGFGYPPSFAFWDPGAGSLELKILENLKS